MMLLEGTTPLEILATIRILAIMIFLWAVIVFAGYGVMRFFGR